MNMINGILSRADHFITDSLAGTAIDAAAHIIHRFTPNVAKISPETIDFIFKKTAWIGRAGAANIGFKIIPHVDYIMNIPVLTARRLHYFMLDVTTGRNTIDGVIDHILKKAKVGESPLISSDTDSIFIDTFKSELRTILEKRAQASRDPLTYPRLANYVAKETVKMGAAGLIRFAGFHYLVGSTLSNYTNIYRIAAISVLAFWMFPMAASTRRDITNLKGPSTDRVQNLMTSSVKQAIFTRAKDIFEIEDDNDKRLKTLENALSKIEVSQKDSWPFEAPESSSAPQQGAPAPGKSPAAAAASSSSRASSSSASSPASGKYRKERHSLKAELKQLQKDSLPYLEKLLEIKKHKKGHLESVNASEEDITKIKAEIFDVRERMDNSKAAETEKPATILDSDDEGECS